MKQPQTIAQALWADITRYPQRLLFRVLLVVVLQQVNIALGGAQGLNIVIAMALIAVYAADLLTQTGRSAKLGTAIGAAMMIVTGVIAAVFPLTI